MPRRRKLFKRADSDEAYASGNDSLDNDDDVDSAGIGSDGDYISDGMNSGSEGVTSDPTGNRRRFRGIRRRFRKSAESDADLLNEPRRVNNYTKKGRNRTGSHDGSSDGMEVNHSEGGFRKFRQRLNPFKGGNRRTRSADDLDSLGLGSADEGAVRRFRLGGAGQQRGKSPSAIRNWRRKGDTGGDRDNKDDIHAHALAS